MGRFQVCGSLASIAAAIFYRNYLSRRVPIQKIVSLDRCRETDAIRFPIIVAPSPSGCPSQMKVVSWVSVPVAASSLLLTLPAFEGRLDPIRVALARSGLLLPVDCSLVSQTRSYRDGLRAHVFTDNYPIGEVSAQGRFGRLFRHILFWY